MHPEGGAGVGCHGGAMCRQSGTVPGARARGCQLAQLFRLQRCSVKAGTSGRLVQSALLAQCASQLQNKGAL